MAIKITVKWNKETYDIDLETQGGLDLLQAKLLSLTSVPIERQKLTCKGKFVRDDAAVQTLQEGAKLILIGSADSAPAKPTTKVVFEEDLSDREKVKMAPSDHVSAGLQNLGNSCFMNATLQCFRAVQPLSEALVKNAQQPRLAAGAQPNDTSDLMTTQLGRLMNELDSSTQSITPMLFTATFRALYPQLAERSPETGGYMQQDADECMSQMMQTLSSKLTNKDKQVASPQKAAAANPWAVASASNGSTASSSASPPSESLIDELFSGQFRTITKCKETDAEPAREETVSFRKMRCVINASINYVSDGLALDLSEELEKRSSVLNRNAIFTRQSRISKLPRYLTVQLVRFYWKNDVKQKAKIVKKVEFPLKLDVADFCDDSLRKSLLAARRVLKAEEDKALGLGGLADRSRSIELRVQAALKEKAIKDAERKATEDAKKTDKEKAKPTSALSGTAMTDVGDEKKDEPKELSEKQIADAAKKAEKAAALAAFKAAPLQPTDTCGNYSLFALITHQGRSADSGHYIGWSRIGSSDKWHKYDDDKVTVVSDDDVKALSGGGDWHMAYLLLYKRIDDFEGRSIEELKMVLNQFNDEQQQSDAQSQKTQ